MGDLVKRCAVCGSVEVHSYVAGEPTMGCIRFLTEHCAALEASGKDAARLDYLVKHGNFVTDIPHYFTIAFPKDCWVRKSLIDSIDAALKQETSRG